MKENQTHKNPILDKEAEIEREWNEYARAKGEFINKYASHFKSTHEAPHKVSPGSLSGVFYQR